MSNEVEAAAPPVITTQSRPPLIAAGRSAETKELSFGFTTKMDESHKATVTEMTRIRPKANASGLEGEDPGRVL